MESTNDQAEIHSLIDYYHHRRTERDQTFSEWRREWEARETSLRNLEEMSRRISVTRDEDASSYAARIPQRQSLYDWAPGSAQEDLYQELLSRANIPTFAQSARTTTSYSDGDSRLTSQSRARQSAREESGQSSPPQTQSSSTMDQGAAHLLLQAMQQHQRLNARARSTMQNYILDRERRIESASSGSTWARLHRSEQNSAGSETRNLPSSLDTRSTYSASLDNPSETRMRNSIRYLSKLRYCKSLEEGLILATDFAFEDSLRRGERKSTHRFTKLSDLLVETSSLPAVQESSWLTPGTRFSGCQHTPRGSILMGRDRRERDFEEPQTTLRERQRRRSQQQASTYRDRLPVPDSSDSPSTLSTADHPSDHWPVTATIHDVDLHKQTLYGTMRATHIPNLLSSPNMFSDSMTSYFEAEIIDFKTHTLLTENFDTGDEGALGGPCGGISSDVRYWRGIGPFRELIEQEKGKEKASRESKRSAVTAPTDLASRVNDRDDAWTSPTTTELEPVEDLQGGEAVLATALRSRSFIESVQEKWILMRWKEKCFVEPDPSLPKSPVPQPGPETSPTAQPPSSSSSTTQPHHTSTQTSFQPSPAVFRAIGNGPWGLTISGFYYVALHRQSGRLEGLYCDHGSAPYQRLCLMPAEVGRNEFCGCRKPGRGEEGGGVSGKGTMPALGFR